jgi:hypothetical protein
MTFRARLKRLDKLAAEFAFLHSPVPQIVPIVVRDREELARLRAAMPDGMPIPAELMPLPEDICADDLIARMREAGFLPAAPIQEEQVRSRIAEYDESDDED